VPSQEGEKAVFIERKRKGGEKRKKGRKKGKRSKRWRE